MQLEKIKNQFLQVIKLATVSVCILFSIQANSASWKKLPVASKGSVGGFIEFNQDSTWTVPVGVTKVNLYVVGGGGGSAYSNASAGGGGGGSCVKKGATELAVANGGKGGGAASGSATAGSKISLTVTVSAGDILNIYVGGGGGAGGFNGNFSSYGGGGGGYGFCGAGGNGGSYNATYVGGVGGLNKGGGGGASTTASGASAASSNGANGGTGGNGGTAASGGNAAGTGSGGGGSGGSGGCSGWYYSYKNGTYSTGLQQCEMVSNANSIESIAMFIADPGAPGQKLGDYTFTGGGPGVVIISW